MSIYFVAQWSVWPKDVASCEKAMEALRDHIQAKHSDIKSVQVFRQSWGPYPRRAYIWLEEFDSLTAMDNEITTPECAKVWQPIEDLAQDGTYQTSIWNDLGRTLWFSR